MLRLIENPCTAPAILCPAALKETADLAVVEVRKGFSHMAYAVGASGKHSYIPSCLLC